MEKGAAEGVEEADFFVGLAVAVTCETRDLGIQWPQWHTLLFEGQVAVDMKHQATCKSKHQPIIANTSGTRQSTLQRNVFIVVHISERQQQQT